MSDSTHSQDLAILLQSISLCEASVEKSRMALSLLPYYTPSLGYRILSEFSSAGLVTLKDISDFLVDWKVDFSPGSLKGFFLDFCPIRNVFEYEDFLLFTSPKSMSEKKETELTLEGLSEDLRFKIESSLVLFFLKEIKYQTLIEKNRLKLFTDHRYNVMDLYLTIDKHKLGAIDYQQMKSFMDSIGLVFEIQNWDNLLFRAKRHRSQNPKGEVLTFTEFHDLIYPITFFEILSQKEYTKWINYFDCGERVEEEDELPQNISVSFVSGYDFTETIQSQNKATNKVTPKKSPGKTYENLLTAPKPSRNLQRESYGDSFSHLTTVKKNHYPRKTDLSFFEGLHKLEEDRMERLSLSSVQQDLPPWTCQNSVIEKSFYELGMNTPWLSYKQKYDLDGLQGAGLESRFLRYRICPKQSASDMYG